MTEYGIVKSYCRNGHYGYIQVVDSHGNPAGEKVQFHLNQARRIITRGDDVTFSNSRATVRELGGVPCVGDTVAFTAVPGYPRRRADAWSFTGDRPQKDQHDHHRVA